MQSLTISPETAANAAAASAAADGAGVDTPGVDTPGVNTQGSCAPVQARSFTFEMPLFRPGVEVQEGGRTETVSHVILRRREMMVYLVGREDPVRPERLRLQPSRFTTARRTEGLNWFL
ncbi:hypothetical protein [Pantoea sp. 18069]|uniref:hypothetical protein n=1 Tax=Pantoea sp. 18069 TaxID=2681415 RepID=UPI00190F9BC7|nr:hypothetical protein [Pantoea sp. 18069]